MRDDDTLNGAIPVRGVELRVRGIDFVVKVSKIIPSASKVDGNGEPVHTICRDHNKSK